MKKVKSFLIEMKFFKNIRAKDVVLLENKEFGFVDEFNQILEKRYIDVDICGLIKKLSSKNRCFFNIRKEVKQIEHLIKELPTTKDCFKFISVYGGFSSIAFIKFVGDRECIEQLYASSLRIGEAQANILDELYKQKKLKKAYFIVDKLFKTDENSRYNYYQSFVDICNKNGWKFDMVNNHSKLILMKTKQNYYVLETSSNLNENPKIEQFNFENDKEAYDFYASFFNEIEARLNE